MECPHTTQEKGHCPISCHHKAVVSILLLNEKVCIDKITHTQTQCSHAVLYLMLVVVDP